MKAKSNPLLLLDQAPHGEIFAMKPILPLLITLSLIIGACVSTPKESIELSQISGQQITELHKSHIKFIQLYYGKLRDDVNYFVDNRWTPAFLTRAVNNKMFRKDLDGAYQASSINASDVAISWKGQGLNMSQQAVVLQGVEQVIANEKSKLGQILLEWSQEAQSQINKKRAELLKPVDDQEKLVITQIDNAYINLQNSQAAIMGYLSSAVNVQQQNDQVLKKLGELEKVDSVLDAVTRSSGQLTTILRGGKDADATLTQFTKQMQQVEGEIRQLTTTKQELK